MTSLDELLKIIDQLPEEQQRQLRDHIDQRLKSNAAEALARQFNQGDVYWLVDAGAREAGIGHPHIVVQDDLFNHSRLTTVVMCALTSNLKKSSLPGNVLIEAGEANLPKASVVEASKLWTVEKSQLGEYIGTVSEERIRQILAGMRFLQASFYKNR